jgi:hypothetical protein
MLAPIDDFRDLWVPNSTLSSSDSFEDRIIRELVWLALEGKCDIVAVLAEGGDTPCAQDVATDGDEKPTTWAPALIILQASLRCTSPTVSFWCGWMIRNEISNPELRPTN